MKRRYRRTDRSLILLLFVVITVSIGYATVATNLKINGVSKVTKATWDVYLANVKVTSGSVSGTNVKTAAAVNSAKNEVTYAVTLSKPGDFYEFTVDAVNNGTINAKIAANGVTNKVFAADGSTAATLPKFITYTVTNSDGTAIAANQTLPKKGTAATTKTFKVRVAYREDISASDLSTLTADTTYTFKFSVQYVQG